MNPIICIGNYRVDKKIKELKNRILTEKERLENGNKILVETGEKVKILKTGMDNLTIEIKAEKLKLPDFSLLSKIKTWHVEKTNLDIHIKGDTLFIQLALQLRKEFIDYGQDHIFGQRLELHNAIQTIAKFRREQLFNRGHILALAAVTTKPDGRFRLIGGPGI